MPALCFYKPLREGMNCMQGQNALEEEKLLVASILKKRCDQVLAFLTLLESDFDF